MLRIGFWQAGITPRLGLPMVGMPGSPPGEGVCWPLRGRVLLADDGQQRLAVVCVDLIALVAADVAALRGRLAAAGSLPPEHILIACSHTHRAPLASAAPTAENPILAIDEAGGSFFDQLSTGLVGAMTEAAAALQPVELSMGRAPAPGWAFNRRPIFRGEQVGTHGWAWADDFVRMEATPDEELWLLVARGADGRVRGGLTGFACHPTAMGHDPVYSADYPGVLTEALEARHRGTFGFLLGAAADTSTPDPTSRDPESGFGRAHTLAMGTALADRAAEALSAGRPLVSGRPRLATARIAIAQRLATPEQVALARWYLEERPPDLDETAFTRRLAGHDYTFRDGVQVGNERHAEEMLRMWAWQQGPDARLVEELELQVMAFGDLAIVAFPAEMFTELGTRLKAASPFPDTVVATLANGWHGYVPTLEAFSRGGYEPRFAYPSRLVPEAGEIMLDAAIGLLEDLAAPV